MPHSLWNGAISFGLVNIPVVLSSAENRNSFDLTMLDRRNNQPTGVKAVQQGDRREKRWGGTTSLKATSMKRNGMWS